MANITGQITLNQLSLVEVDADPAAGAGTAAPVGSYAFFNNGTNGFVYLKTGTANTAWNLITSQSGVFTSQRVPFANTNGQLTDAASLTYNSATTTLFVGTTTGSVTGKIGINTANPEGPLHLVDDTTADLIFDQITDVPSQSSNFNVRRARGTVGAFGTVQSGDKLSGIAPWGWDGTAWGIGLNFEGFTTENWTSTAHGAEWRISTTPNASTANLQALTIRQDGLVVVDRSGIRIGNTTDATNGNIRFNGLGMEFFRNGWRDLSFPKYSYDDFLWTTLGSGTNPYSWVGVVANGATAAVEGAPTTNNYSGNIQIATGTTNNNTGVAALSAFNAVNKFILGGFPLTHEWRVRVPILSGTPAFELRVGLQDGTAAGDPTNGVYFTYSNGINSGNWQGVNRSASTSTLVNSTVAVAANVWYRLRLEFTLSPNTVTFFVDSGSGYVSIGSATLNIPTAVSLRPVAKINKTGAATATSRLVDLDWSWWVLER